MCCLQETHIKGHSNERLKRAEKLGDVNVNQKEVVVATLISMEILDRGILPGGRRHFINKGSNHREDIILNEYVPNIRTSIYIKQS